MLHALVGIALRHRIAALATAGLLAVLAAWIGRHLQLDALPDVTTNQVVILTNAPGLAPIDVESLVTRRGGAPGPRPDGLETSRSLSRYGISSVTLVFADHIDPWRARQAVGERLSALAGTLPAGVEPPQLAPFTGGLGEVYHLVLRARTLDRAALLEAAELRGAPLLRMVPGVVEVNFWGGARRTFELRADPLRLARHGLTLQDVAAQVAAGTGRVAGASLPLGPGQALVAAQALPSSPETLAARTVRTPTGSLVPLHALGTVAQGEQVRTGSATADGGGEVVYLMVQMLRGANALELCTALEERLPALRAALPAGVEVDVLYDRAVLVRRTLRTVATNLAEGGLLVVVVLFAMLGSARAGLLVAMVIPASMLGALAAMVLLDVPGNLMSLGAIDFGLLVDGAVVIVEALFHEAGGATLVAGAGAATAWRAQVAAVAKRASRPVFFAVLVIALVYVPILGLQGVDGRMFRPMAVVVIAALLTSLGLALLVVPAAASVWLRPQDVPHHEPWLVRGARSVWQPLLRGAMGHPRLVAALALATLAGGAWLGLGLGTAFIPTLDEGDLVIQTERSPDIAIESAAADAGRLEAGLLREVPELRSIVSRIGSPEVATDIMGLEQSDVFVRVADPAQWRPGLDREGLLNAVAAAVARLDPAAGAAMTQPIQMRFNELVGGAVNDVTAEVYGVDLDGLRASAERIAAALPAVPGVVDVRVLTPPDVPWLTVEPDAVAAARVGLTAADILGAVQALRVGVDMGMGRDGLIEVPLRLRLGPAHPDDAAAGEGAPSAARPLGHPADAGGVAVAAAAIEDLVLPTPSGRVVPLRQVATITRAVTPSRISRDDGERRVVVGFNVRGRDLGGAVADAQQAVAAHAAPLPGQRLRWGGQFATLQEARARMAVVLPVTLVLVLLTLVVAFRALGPALLVLTLVPFAAVGGVAALVLRELPLSISALIGFIALGGISVLNGVVLVARVGDLREGGMAAAAAMEQAVHERMRPVLTTALVAALGFVPMMLATGAGAEVQRPLATVVVGGLASATAVTLVVLPAVYAWLAGGRGRGAGAEPQPDTAA